ncbi:N-acetylmuramoyl-L-alanine amidase [Clostridium butyricum]|uniref:N-acetylmuramoyl-L-alanine amidase n=1 Tax=Clostridium butyricum TaxID=1492 RepID=UPI002ABDA5E4|nr:N-acetylmuramoyl-L-alanine amidase [Clostridium butyricum]
MKIGLRAGHSDNCTGAIGIVNEHEQMKLYYAAIKNVLEQYGHTVIDCNSNAYGQNEELSEGARKANNNNIDLFISLHMNSFNGSAHGCECLVSSTTSKSYNYAVRLCNNYESLGFQNRGVKCERLFEMNHISAPNIISEICFCDNQNDIDIYNKYSWNKLAYTFCNAIDPNIPKDPGAEGKGYVITNYLPSAYEGYEGIDINYVLSYFQGIKCYVRSNSKGIWIETQYMDMNKCNELKNKLGSWFYSIEK